MNKEAFAKVLASESQSTSDRLIVGDLPGNQWFEIPVDGQATVKREFFGVDFSLRFQAADEFQVPFRPEHAFWVSRGGISGGRLFLCPDIRKDSDGNVTLRFRAESGGSTQMMRPIEFTIDPELSEAEAVADHTEVQFITGFTAYDAWLKEDFPKEWERIAKLRAKLERTGWL